MPDTKKFDEETFKKEILESDKPVIVDFWAEWCGPCRMISPILEEISTEYNNKIELIKINVDENYEISSKYNITSIPTIFLFNEGKIVKKVIGAVSKTHLLNEFKDYLK